MLLSFIRRCRWPFRDAYQVLQHGPESLSLFGRLLVDHSALFNLEERVYRSTGLSAACLTSDLHDDRLCRNRLDTASKYRRLIESVRIPAQFWFREIARATGCPFAKVVYIENRLQQRVRAVLSDDAELAGLRAEARRAGAGVDTPINETVSRRVATAVGARFQRLFRAQSQEGKAVVMLALMKEHGVNVERLATALFDRLTNKDRFNRMCGWFELHTPEHGNP